MQAFIFAGLALLALIVLSASLSSLKMSDGQPFSMAQLAPDVNDSNISTEGTSWIIAVFRLMMILFWVALPIYIVLLLISKEERKRFLRTLLFWTPIIILLLYLLNRKPNPNSTQDLSQSLMGNPNPGPQATIAPPPEFVPPPQWVTTFATIAISLTIALIALGVFYVLWRQARNRRQLKEPLKVVEKEARAALDLIASGGDLREAVIRCYLQMIEALQVYRGINRDLDITPHEFEMILSKRGMPSDSVHQLTLLFEEVRYGTLKPGRKDEQVAISSLSAIISACQKVAERHG
jgi:hypothetical protein